MSSPVLTTLPDETVASAAAVMHERSVGSVVVVDGDRPIGILTERDIVRMAAAGPLGRGLKVAELMTADPDCVAPELSVQEAFATLADHGYRHIPVVEASDSSASCRCATSCGSPRSSRSSTPARSRRPPGSRA